MSLQRIKPNISNPLLSLSSNIGFGRDSSIASPGLIRVGLSRISKILKLLYLLMAGTPIRQIHGPRMEIALVGNSSISASWSFVRLTYDRVRNFFRLTIQALGGANAERVKGLYSCRIFAEYEAPRSFQLGDFAEEIYLELFWPADKITRGPYAIFLLQMTIIISVASIRL